MDYTNESYPIIIPTLNRYVHFRRCVESLTKNSMARDTELIIGIDFPPSEKYIEGWKKICEYVPTISGFKTVTVFKHNSNLGAEKNIEYLSEYAFSNYDALILSEDDNEFSSCFLEFMNDSLKRFADDDKVESICGYTSWLYYGLSDCKIIANEDHSAWGIGIWKRKNKSIGNFTNAKIAKLLLRNHIVWRIYSTYPALLGMLLEMLKKNVLWGDTVNTTLNIIYGKVQIKPGISMVRNWGHDGSGLHCGETINDAYSAQKIDTSLHYNYDGKGFYNSKKLTGKMFCLGLPDNFFKRSAILILILLRYLQFRLNVKKIVE